MVESENKLTGIELALMAVGGPRRNRKTLLAKRLGVTRQTIFYWTKTGEIPLSQVKHVSKVLGLPPHLLNSLFATED